MKINFAPVVGIAICLSLIVTSPTFADIEKIRVARFHAPGSFVATLKKVDRDTLVVLTDGQWFDPSSANAWVVFVSSNRDHVALPDLAIQVLDAVSGNPNDLVRVSVELANGNSLRVQLNDLQRTKNGASFQGCVSALDIASIAYGENILTPMVIDDYCKNY